MWRDQRWAETGFVPDWRVTTCRAFSLSLLQHVADMDPIEGLHPVTILTLMLLTGVLLLVVAIGIGVPPGWPLLLQRRPWLALRAMGAMYVGMPAFVLLLVWLLPLHGPVSAALLGLAISPVLPPWGRKAALVGGRSNDIIGLQLLSSGTAVLLIPLMIWLVEHLFRVQTTLDPLAVELVLLVTVAVPLAVGIGIARWAPQPAARLAVLADRVGSMLLLLGGVLLTVLRGSAILGVIGQGTLVAIAAVVIVGLLLGHALGGPDPRTRGVLASATVYRHPAIALILASGSGKPDDSVIGTVLLYMLVSLVLSRPYERWRQRVIAS
jgi:BASS family bile acid:Na+ symporter